MSTDICTILTLAKKVCDTTNSAINLYSTTRQLRKQEMNELKVRIDAYLTAAYTRYAGDLTRSIIEEIAKTQRFIDEQNLSGAALDYAMDQLANLNDNLSRALNNFKCA